MVKLKARWSCSFDIKNRPILQKETWTEFSNLSQIGHSVFEKEIAVQRSFFIVFAMHYIDEVNEQNW